MMLTSLESNFSSARFKWNYVLQSVMVTMAVFRLGIGEMIECQFGSTDLPCVKAIPLKTVNIILFE